MSGPALRKIDSHEAIHDAALQEAQELTNVVANLLKEGDVDRALEAAYITVEHWETRTLAHADAEEKGLYQEIVENSPDLSKNVTALMRDHDILRLLIKEVKEILEKDGICERVLNRFHALILVDELHNKEEMKVLPEH
ncbi:hemerythrin domain-containing protein [Saliterribacillus persicus]|uniref:Hemerythrin HHE cation binding domain-containing protein n=1 Tax=Saliterribacillus persicus TaxID=930114 RepID=A0A368XIM0_9BACI|nr:hemerythrin domain-containing protein [Saliterribacillus persicus]RCW67026.1 hemerythrin HHE cation binding domain-containing protein [Saliterribacillus persicus]